MDLVTVRELYKNREAYLDKEVSIGGWVRSVRASKAFGFIVVSDGTYFETLQVVYHDNVSSPTCVLGAQYGGIALCSLLFIILK